MYTFETPAPTSLVIRSGAGHVHVTAEETARTTVELTPLNAAGEDAVAEARVEQQRHGVVVDIPRHRGGLFRPHPSVGITVTVPTGSTLEVKAESADITATGSYGEALVTTGSGEVQVGDVTGSAKLKSGSGDVVAGHIGKALVVSTGSGDVRVDHSGRSASVSVGSGDIRIGEVAGEVLTKTGSGDIEVDRLGGSLTTKSGSGSLVVHRAASGAVRANGASGSISIGVEEGTAAWLDVSTLTGRVSQELQQTGAPTDGQQQVEITAHTVSGNLRVHRS
ncbi:MAG: DUF4097 family beta strand repeat-containing protein [Marmoricola sp.]